MLDSPAAVHEAQRLHARVYLEREYITHDAVGSDGRMKPEFDSYQDHAVYFAVVDTRHPDSRIIATARQIQAQPDLAHDSFPSLKSVHIPKSYDAQIRSLEPRRIVEISGLAKLRGHSPFAAMLLYRKMWQYSLEADHALWVMACDTRVYRNLKILFSDTLTEIGPESFYMGSNVVPAIIDIPGSLRYIMKPSKSLNPIRSQLHKKFARFFLRGIEADQYLRRSSND
jgi:N-acyl-L-homoserine lactone synthetase